MPDLSLLSWTEISCCTRTNMSDALSDDGHGFWRFCPRDVSAYSLVCGSLSLASLVILTRSSVDWSLKWSISPRSLFSTTGELLSAVPLVCGHIGWSRLSLLCWRGCRCLYEEYAQRGSNGLLEFATIGAFPGNFYIVTYLWFLLEI